MTTYLAWQQLADGRDLVWLEDKPEKIGEGFANAEDAKEPIYYFEFQFDRMFNGVTLTPVEVEQIKDEAIIKQIDLKVAEAIERRKHPPITPIIRPPKSASRLDMGLPEFPEASVDIPLPVIEVEEIPLPVEVDRSGISDAQKLQPIAVDEQPPIVVIGKP